MRHKVAKYQLDRPTHQRLLMFRTMVTDLIRVGHMKTTLAKAKAIQPITEKMVTLAKRDNFNTRRRASEFVVDKKVIVQLFEDVAPNYRDVNGGYTRITKLGRRAGDSAEMALIELIQPEE